MFDATEPMDCTCGHCGHAFRATPEPGSRLLCGDSTRGENVDRLMNGAKAALCLTDPPYSVNYDNSQAQRGGDAAVHGPYHEAAIDPSQLLTFMAHVPADVMIWSYPLDRHFHALSEAYRRHGWEFKKELVWVKDSFSFWMSAKYQQKHEPIMLAVRSGCPIGGEVPANATTVFEYPRPKAHELHPTAKPVGLWAEFIGNHAQPGDIVYEPFCGSGTTIVAAEQLGRRCFAIEISPTYVDVAVSRWEQLTGKKAILAR
jgi:DNA modification methylase